MNKSIDDHNNINDFIKDKAIALMNHESKNGTQTSFPLSNYTYYEIHKRHFFCIGTNTFMDIIYNGTLTIANKSYTSKFGTGNAIDVINAIYLTTKETNPNLFTNYENRLEDFTDYLSNAHCYLVEKSNNNFNNSILRLDLFRLFERTKEDENIFDFTGGLFHSFKHFSLDEINLSVGKENKTELYHPIRIVKYAIKAFFTKPLENLLKPNKFSSIVEYNLCYNLKFIFHFEVSTGVYFIDTIIKVKK